MKFSSISIALIAAFTGHVIANPTVVEETTASTLADAPVTVTVTCDGATIDWPKLSLSELTIAGTALVESYNAVHVDLPNDDSQLRDLVYSGASNRRMFEEHDDTSNLGWWGKPKPLKGMQYIYHCFFYHGVKYLILSTIVIVIVYNQVFGREHGDARNVPMTIHQKLVLLY